MTVIASQPATSGDPTATAVGIVVIGRNEGDRLRRCLASTPVDHGVVVYVDSGSIDGSPAAARAMGASVVDLDMSSPFSAARARNAGFGRLAELRPDTEFVQFIDGDCEMNAGWLARAVAEFRARPDAVVVCGLLRERYPEASVYNRLCDLEWNSRLGEIEACGGIAMYRATAFRASGGFDPTVTAGEEPELCARLRADGGRVLRVDHLMAWHGAAMHTFRQWWTRSVRGGYGAADVLARFGLPRYRRQVRSARVWTVGWCGGVVLGGTAGFLAAGPLGSAVGTGVFLSVPLLQAARLASGALRRGVPLQTALHYGVLTVVSKWAQIQGQWRFVRDMTKGRHARLIEYKKSQSPLDCGAIPLSTEPKPVSQHI